MRQTLLKSGSLKSQIPDDGQFRTGGARPPTEDMIAFVNHHRYVYGVEPICRVLPIAPSIYYENDRRRRHPETASPRVRRDEALKPEVLRVFKENFAVYGANKVWQQMKQEGFDVTHGTVQSLMKALGLQGIIRGKAHRTTYSDKVAPCLLDKVNGNFYAPAPNRFWVSDFIYVSNWSGFFYVDCVIDVFARRIVGWRISRTAHAGFVLDTLEQALHDRRLARGSSLVYHSDHGSQNVSMRHTERLVEAGLELPVSIVGDSYYNALTETINGLCKAKSSVGKAHGNP